MSRVATYTPEEYRVHRTEYMRIYMRKRREDPEYRAKDVQWCLKYQHTPEGREAKRRADHKWKQNHPETWGYFWDDDATPESYAYWSEKVGADLMAEGKV